MDEITIDDVLKATGGVVKSKIKNQKSKIIRGISIDSRTIKPGDLFIAIKGSKNDGHNFVSEAVKSGAVAAMVEYDKFQVPNSKFQIIVVDDTLRALGDLAGWYRKRFSLPITGVTGSNGKTTTKELIAKCLGIRYRVCKSESSFNSLTGVPLSLFNLSSKHEVCVFEIGANQVGEIARLTSIVKPKIGVITNIGPVHLENFKTIEGVLNEKLNLVRGAEVAVLNADDEFLGRVQMKAFEFGIEKGDLRAKLVESGNGIKFKVCIGEVTLPLLFELPLLGKYQVYNALAALSVGIHFDLGLKEMSETLKDVKPFAHRNEVIEVKIDAHSTIKIIDSSYNANPMSMELGLRELVKYKPRRCVAILGDMLELGDNAYSFHTRIGKLLKELGIDVIIAYGQLAQGYIEKSKVKNQKSKIYYFTDMKELKEELNNIIKPGDVILVKGSRAMKMEEVVESLRSKSPKV